MELDNRIFLQYQEEVNYPTGEWNYSPSEQFPEYPFPDVSNTENKVYAMVRDGLFWFGLDEAHYGTEDWNPMGDIITPGDRVLIKPNLVSHTNPRGGWSAW